MQLIMQTSDKIAKSLLATLFPFFLLFLWILKVFYSFVFSRVFLKELYIGNFAEL